MNTKIITKGDNMENTNKNKCKQVYKERMNKIKNMECGLRLVYIPKGMLTGQKRGYFRCLTPYSGQSDEFRIYTGPDLQLEKIEFWYLTDKVNVKGKNFEVFEEIWDDWKDMGTLDQMI